MPPWIGPALFSNAMHRKKISTGLPTREAIEREKCRRSFRYFAETYVQIEDTIRNAWVPFVWWPVQIELADLLVNKKRVAILKARQLGFTLLVLSHILHQAIFRGHYTAMVFSRRDFEAVHLLSSKRLRGMIARLPDWLRPELTKDDASAIHFSNGSAIYAFPTTAGDSYSASTVFVDEADLVPDLNRVISASKPTVDAGGQMILLSKVNKRRGDSPFVSCFGDNSGWTQFFAPWWARPDRTQAWYDETRHESLNRTRSLDELWENYPASIAEALAAATSDKRMDAAWLTQCFRELPTISLTGVKGAPSVPGLRVYLKPAPGRRYCMGSDTAEGNPGSNDSTFVVLDAETGAEAASFAGRIEVSQFASYIKQVAAWYNGSPVLVERNNHGHAVILWLEMDGATKLIPGRDGRPGWLTSGVGNTLLYNALADALRDGTVAIHSRDIYTQIGSIEGSTLSAPEGKPDDLADGFALANQARTYKAGVFVFDRTADVEAELVQTW